MVDDFSLRSHFLVTLRDLSLAPTLDGRYLDPYFVQLFHIVVTVKGRSSLVVVDIESRVNAVSEELLARFSLKTSEHPRPYKLRWLGSSDEV